MKRVLATLFLYLSFAIGLIAQQPPIQLRVTRGVTLLSFDEKVLAAAGVDVPSVSPSDTSAAGTWQFIVRGKSNLQAMTDAGGDVAEIRGRLVHAGGFVLSAGPRVLRAREFQLVDGTSGQHLVLMAGNLPVFRIAKTQLRFRSDTALLTLAPSPLVMTTEASAALGVPTAGGTNAGTIEMTLATAPSDATAFAALPAVPGPIVPGPPLIIASDLTFCSLDDLRQLGRVGDIAALSASTTSWNIGPQKLDWWESPDWRHPYIVLNMYRIRNDRFEQIGQSWVKHGFFALSESQCDTQCSEETDGTQLAPGCTDTYPTETNAFQGVLGPRFEIDPWEGVWTDTGLHPPPGHSHDPIQHRLQVRDADLDPGQNDGANYVLEGYYVHYQDTDVTNSAAWKPVTIAGGSPGGTWIFSMSGANVRPKSGFAIDAWAGARQTVFAGTVPPVEFQSADGRAVLAAKSSVAGAGTWRYSYALLNVDMDRQISSFEVSLPPETIVTDLQFHAPRHSGEPVNAPGGTPIDNAAWTGAVTGNAVKWSTTANPVRWGTVYTFSFVANRSPGDVRAALVPFRGTPATTLAARTVGPSQ